MVVLCLTVAAYARRLVSVLLRQTIVRQGGLDLMAMVEI